MIKMVHSYDCQKAIKWIRHNFALVFHLFFSCPANYFVGIKKFLLFMYVCIVNQAISWLLISC